MLPKSVVTGRSVAPADEPISKHVASSAAEAAKLKTQQQSSVSTAVLKASALDPLPRFLNKHFDGPSTERPKAETIGDVLDRYKDIQAVFANLKSLGWARSSGGYQIPEGKVRCGWDAMHRVTYNNSDRGEASRCACRSDVHQGRRTSCMADQTLQGFWRRRLI